MHDRLEGFALEAFEIKDLIVDSGEQMVLRELDEKFPDQVEADRTGETMLLFTPLQNDGVKPLSRPPHARAQKLTKSAQPSVRRFLGARQIACQTGRLPEEGLEPEMIVGTKVQYEIETITAGVEPIEESGAVGVIATWRQPKTAMPKEKLARDS